MANLITEQFTRRFRPKTFSEVVSQVEAVSVLRNSIINNKVQRFILLRGSRGCGKTTLSRIYARAVNCEHPINGDPCGECPSCREILSGQSQDVIELDAASKRSIDDMRQLEKQLDYATFSAKYRVIILDEVHSLTPEAWQSLLKTLEEPRQNCIFIMCTTDADKVPDTILSRATILTIKRIKASDIYKKLEHICFELGLTPENRALEIIANKSKGITRDAVKDLDTVYSCFNGEITEQNVQKVFSVIDTKVVLDFISSIYSDDVSVVLNMAQEIENLFADSRRFLVQLCETTLDCVQIKLGVDLSQKYSDTEIQQMKLVISKIPSKFLWSLVKSSKEQINTYNQDIPVLDYLVVELKDQQGEISERSQQELEQKQKFNLDDELDDL